MADAAYVQQILTSLEEDVKRQVGAAFDYVLKDVRFGQAGEAEPCVNLGGGLFRAMTHAVANTEFSIAHNFGRIPYLLIPVLPGNVVGAKIVRLENARAWDAQRIYLKSPETDAEIYFYLEG